MSARRGCGLVLPLLAALLSGCGGEPPPPLPPLSTLVSAEDLEPVRAQIGASREAAEAAPKEGDATGHLGMVLSAYGQSAPAAICYRRARILDPAIFRWPYYEAVSLADLGHLDEAISVMEEALALQPEHLEGRMRLAGWLAETGKPERVRALYEAVLAANPHRAEARLGLGRLLLETGDAEGAVAQLRAALETDWRVGEVHYALSRALREIGDQAGAEQHAALFKRFEQRRLHLADPLVRTVTELNLSDKPHLTRAAWYREQGRPEEATAALEQALAVNPDNAPARLDLMEIQANNGRTEDARAQYHAAVGISPEDPEPHLRWARLQRWALDYPGAEEALVRALALHAEGPNTLADLGFALEQQRRNDEAAERYTQALALAPSHLSAHAGLGRLRLAAKDPAGAIPHLERAAAAPGADRPYLHYQLALAYKDADRPEAARKTLEEARPLAAAGVDPGLSRDIETALQSLQPTEHQTQ